MDEPNVTESFRWLGDTPDEALLATQEAELERWHQIRAMFATPGWRYVMEGLRSQERADLELLTSVPLDAVPAHRARLMVVRTLLATERNVAAEITKLEAQQEDLGDE